VADLQQEVGVAMTVHYEDHPEDNCQRCGGRNITWFVDGDRFNTACNRSEIVCPTCFVLAHERATGMRCCWELSPGGVFRWISAEGRPTPFIGEPS
jgi:hypothetical protein